MNRLNLLRIKVSKTYLLFIHTLHKNIFLMVGFYGLLLAILLCLLTPWLATDSQQTYPHLHLLLPAWYERGQLNHILGIDNNGYDIFKQLLWASRNSLFITLLITFCVMLIGTIASLCAVFIKSSTRIILIICKIITTIPPLLTMIIFVFFRGNTVQNLMFVIMLTMLPRFIYNIYHIMSSELKKPYITAVRLDGLSIFGIMRYSILPNTWNNYVRETIAIFTTSLIALTTLTFLNFGVESNHNELGMMMHDMIAIIEINYWGFIAPGLVILVMILLLNFFDYGLRQSLSHRE